VIELLLNLAAVAAGAVALRSVMQNLAPGGVETVAAVGVCLATALAVFVLSEPPNLFEDFEQHYYIGGEAVRAGPAALGPLVERGVEDGFTNLPIVAYLFLPFALLPLQAATLIFTLLGLAMTFFAWLLLVRLAYLDRAARWWLLFLFAASGPLHYSVREGNTSHMVLLGVAAGLYFLRAGKPVVAGALLGVAAVLKLPLLLFGVLFVLRRNWGSALGFASVCAGSVALSLVVFGLEVNRSWLVSVKQYGREPLGAFNVQSIPAALVRLVEGPAVLLDFTPHSVGTAQRLVGLILVGLLYVAAVLACRRRIDSVRSGTDGSQTGKELEYLLVLNLAVISSPLSWSHYYALLLIPMAFFLGARFSIADVRLRRLGWLGIAFTVPVVSVLHLPGSFLPDLYARLGISHLLFGGLILFGLLVIARRRVARDGMLPPQREPPDPATLS